MRVDIVVRILKQQTIGRSILYGLRSGTLVTIETAAEWHLSQYILPVRTQYSLG